MTQAVTGCTLGEWGSGGFREGFLEEDTKRRGMKKADRQRTTWKAWGMASHLEYEYLERVSMQKGTGTAKADQKCLMLN